MISSNALAVGSDEVCAEIVLLSFCSFTDISCDCVPSVFVKASSRVLLGMVVRSVFVRGRSMTVKRWRVGPVPCLRFQWSSCECIVPA